MKKWLLLTAIDIVTKVLQQSYYSDGSKATHTANLFEHHIVPILLRYDGIQPKPKRRLWSFFAEG